MHRRCSREAAEELKTATICFDRGHSPMSPGDPQVLYGAARCARSRRSRA